MDTSSPFTHSFFSVDSPFLFVLLLLSFFNILIETYFTTIDIHYSELSNDVASGIEITPCNKIDKPLVVYRLTGKRYDVHNNVAYIMTKL